MVSSHPEVCKTWMHPFGHPFPDLFESVVSTFTELSMPRRSSLSQQPNPWHSQPVPAYVDTRFILQSFS